MTAVSWPTGEKMKNLCKFHETVYISHSPKCTHIASNIFQTVLVENKHGP